MANKFNRFLGDMLTGFLAPKGNMADFQHASRLYVDNGMRLAPKTKFLYYAVFNINPNVLDGSGGFQDQNRLEINYLVKKMDLPKYSFELEQLNQYNRKTSSYKKITYEPVNITFHDDNQGVSNSLWALYYGYYIADRMNSQEPYGDTYPAAYQGTAYLSKESAPFRYGLDNDSFEPFFHSIELFTLSKQRFFSYMLCNPKITSWQHDSLDQSDGAGVLENTMGLAYDAVIYNAGYTTFDDPSGFTLLHYDNTPSPLGGGGGALVGGLEALFGDVYSANAFAGPGSYLSNIRNGFTFDNYGNQASYGAGSPIFSSPVYRDYYSPTSVSGLQNYSFGSSNNIANLANATIAGAALGGVVGGAVGGLVGGAIKGLGNAIGGIFGGAGKEGAESPVDSAPNASTAKAENAASGAKQVAGVEGGKASDVNEPGFSGESGKILQDTLNPPKPLEQGSYNYSNAEQYAKDVNGMDAYLGESKTTSGEVQGPPQFQGDESAGYTGANGQILADATATTPQPDLAQELIANNPGGSGNAETDVGSPFG
jgi:hypothetical protein